MVHLSILMANHFMISCLYSCSCAHRPSPYHFCQLSRGEGGPFVPVRRDQGAARNCARSPASKQAPPSGAGGKCRCVDGALKTWAGEGEPVFSKVRFLVLWAVAVWGKLNRGAPWDFAGIFITLRRTFGLDSKYSQINPRCGVLQSVECWQSHCLLVPFPSLFM